MNLLMMLTRCLKFNLALLFILTNQSFAEQKLDLVRIKVAEYLSTEQSDIRLRSISEKLNLDSKSVEKGTIQCNERLGRCSLIYKFSVRKGFSAVRVAWFSVERLESVAILKVDVFTGDEFSFGLVEFDKKHIQLGLNPKRDLLSTMKFKADLKQGSILRNIDLEKNPLINENEKVIVNVYSGLISLRTEGIALNSGVLGEKIKVVRLSNKQIFDALIISNGEVEVR